MVPRIWEKVLVVQTSFLGDTVLTLPLLSEIKRRFPSSQLSLLCTPLGQALLTGHPAVDETIVDDKKSADRGWLGLWRKAKLLRKKGFTMALCPHKSFRSGLLLFLAKIPYRVGFAQSKSLSCSMFESTGMPGDTTWNALFQFSKDWAYGQKSANGDSICRSAAETRQEVAQRLRSLGVDTSRLLVGLHPGSVWATKRWSAEGFARLIGMLKERYPCEILLFGGPEDAEVIAQVQNLCGGRAVSLVERIALPELPAALDLCKVLVTNDSGPMHIAVARAVPVVAIFCATTPALGFYPYSSKAIVLEKDLPMPSMQLPWRAALPPRH